MRINSFLARKIGNAQGICRCAEQKVDGGGGLRCKFGHEFYSADVWNRKECSRNSKARSLATAVTNVSTVEVPTLPEY
jgi:hypothetical protein